MSTARALCVAMALFGSLGSFASTVKAGVAGIVGNQELRRSAEWFAMFFALAAAVGVFGALVGR